MKRARMMGRLKHFGRCNSPGHGSRCVLSREIQTKTLGRAAEKRRWKAGAE